MFEYVLKFWFEELKPTDWFKSSERVDSVVLDRFLETHQAAVQGELFRWRDTIQGRLAEIIVLDQFSRCIYRRSKQAFTYDGMALILAQEAVKLPEFEELNSIQKAFACMPFMHSESPEIHNFAIQLFMKEGLERNYQLELEHKAIIDEFGRYPQRNEILDRKSTKSELEYLKHDTNY